MSARTFDRAEVHRLVDQLLDELESRPVPRRRRASVASVRLAAEATDLERQKALNVLRDRRPHLARTESK